MRSLALICASLGALALSTGTTYASTMVQGKVVSLHHFEGHHGILVKIEQMTDPQACGRSDWYMLPDSSPHAQFVQAMLLTAQNSQQKVYISINGCLDGMPLIQAVNN